MARRHQQGRDDMSDQTVPGALTPNSTNTPASAEPTPAPKPQTDTGNAANYLTLFTWPRAVQPGALNDNHESTGLRARAFRACDKDRGGCRCLPGATTQPPPSRYRRHADGRAVAEADIPRPSLCHRPPRRRHPGWRSRADNAPSRIDRGGEFPTSLPFHFAWEQVKAVLRHRQALHLGYRSQVR